MNANLSPRLLLCCRYVNPGDRVADIGCDHGFLGIHLLEGNIASYVYACDINEGPLQSAVHNANRYGLQDKMSFYLTSGVQNIPRDFDTMVCAGMGADTMITILSAAPWLQNRSYRLILQCQSKTHMLRRYLSENGWQIRRENVVRDGRFLYTVMEVVYEPGQPLTNAQCYFPPALLQDDSPELAAYYGQILYHLHKAVDSQKEKADPNTVLVLDALENDPKLLFLKEQ